MSSRSTAFSDTPRAIASSSSLPLSSIVHFSVTTHEKGVPLLNRFVFAFTLTAFDMRFTIRGLTEGARRSRSRSWSRSRSRSWSGSGSGSK